MLLDTKTITTSNKNNAESPVYSLVSLMSLVNLDSPEAELNATTISDGNGGRILL